MQFLIVFVSFIAFLRVIQSDGYKKCGVRLEPKHDKGRSVIDATEWPWLTSLVLTSTGKVFCGGSIVSEHYVITAAHCVSNKRRIMFKSKDILVYLGKYNLSASEDDSEWFHPYDIRVHPDWEADGQQFDADIAILVAEVPIPFSQNILSICLWTDLQEDEDFVGTVVGWGRSGMSGSNEVPNQMQVLRVPSTRCYEDFHLIVSIASSRTFCAGGVEINNGPCAGDSGSGFFIEKNGVWFIQGIVSATFLSESRRCDATKYSLYTKINEFISWVNVKSRDHKVVFQCNFDSEGFEGNILTRCSSIGLSVLQPAGKVKMAGKKPSIDVGWMEINEQDTVYLPNGIGSLFPNLTILEIDNSKVRFIERSNFEHMENLVQFHLTSNPITNIPFDSFHDLKNLQELHLSTCRLTKLHSSLLTSNVELKIFNASENQLETLPSDLFKNNKKLEIIFITHNRLKFVDDQLFSNLFKIQHIDLSQNVIQNISSNAFRDLTDMRSINLNNNKLKGLDAEIFTNNILLEVARVMYNQIEEFLPGLFRKHLKMIAIGMNHNNVKVIHSHFFDKLQSLKAIDFTGMSIKELPFDLFFLLPQFETFVADTNELIALHKDLFSKNPKLIVFSAKFNRIEELDSSLFKNNLALNFVRFSHNRLKTIERNLFKNLKHLKNIDLSYNLIETIPADAFADLRSLQLLRLNDNNLRALSEDLFVHNINLNTLLVFSNEIEYLPAELFKMNIFLTKISFANNFLTKIETIFDTNQEYNLFDFSGNRCLSVNGTDHASYDIRIEDIMIAINLYCA